MNTLRDIQSIDNFLEHYSIGVRLAIGPKSDLLKLHSDSIPNQISFIKSNINNRIFWR